jgi:hypothetical protein
MTLMCPHISEELETLMREMYDITLARLVVDSIYSKTFKIPITTFTNQ